MKGLKGLLTCFLAILFMIAAGCSNKGCPTSPADQNGRPGGGGNSDQKLFKKDMRK